MTVRDQARGTLNLVVTTRNKVVELQVDPKKVPKIDVIHLHKEIGDNIYPDMLQDTMQISKLQSCKKTIKDLL